MGVILDLSAIALRQVVPGALKAVGVEIGGEAVAKFLVNHFTDHSQKLSRALQQANERAWKAMEVALAGESFWEKVKGVLARAEDRAFREQVRAFLDVSPLRKVKAEQLPILARALQDLRDARSKGLLTEGELSAAELARQAGVFATFREPQALLDAEWKAIDRVGAALRSAYPTLHRVLTARTSSGHNSPSLLAVAVRYYFRRLVETDEELFRSLAFANLRAIGETQDQGFAALTEALSKQGQRLESMLIELTGVVIDTNARVRNLEVQIQKLLDLLQLQKRELRPSDSLCVRGEAEQQKVQQVVAEYHELPDEVKQQRPDLINDVGKLEVAAGDFEAAQRTFEEAARATTDPRAQAEAHHNAYRAALERQQWAEALDALKQAAALDAERFAPFPLSKYAPQRILGAGGFGVVFLCQHLHLDEPVVIKSLLAAELDRDVKEVFTEAKAMQVKHPNIVRVWDCEFADRDGKRPYLVMEYFDGVNLADHVAAHGPLSPADLLGVARPIAEALQAAHQRGFLHRDVKPANVLVRRDPDGWKVKLIDFGLAMRPDSLGAKASTQARQPRTTIGRSIAGTVHYAAPEQMGEGARTAVGTYSDVYGFGRTCYYSLLRTPKPDEEETDGLPADWRTLLRQCTRRDASKRLADFAAVLSGLAGITVTVEPPTERPPDVRVVERQQDGEDDAIFRDLSEEDGAPEGVDESEVGLPDFDEVPLDGVSLPVASTAANPLADGIACMEQKDFAQAVKAFTLALKADSRLADAYRQRARAHAQRGHLDKAMADLDQLVKLEPKVPANLVERGRAHAAAGNADRAINDFTQAVLCGGKSAELFVARANCYAVKEVWDLAFADFDAAAQLSPGNAETHFQRGEARLRQGAFDQALGDFAEAASLRPEDVRFVNARGRVFLRQGKIDEAMAEFIKASHLDPHCAETYVNRGRVRLQQGQNEQAIAELTHALDFDPRCAEALAGRGLARSRLGQFGWALSDYNKAIKLRPRDAALYVGRGEVQSQRENHEEALEDFQAAIKLDRTLVAAYLGRGRGYLVRGHFGSAIGDFTRALELRPGDREALIGRATAYVNKKQNDEAISDATEVIRLDPASAWAYRVRGWAHRNKKAYDQAISDLGESIRLESAASCYFDRGLAYYLSGDNDKAVADFTSAIKMDGRNADYYLHRARAYEKKGDRVKGREDRAKVAELNPTPPSDAGTAQE